MDMTLYEQFQQTIHNPQQINTLLDKIQSVQVDSQKNLLYVVDRVVKAAMSTDIGIKLNAASILEILLKTHPEEINRQQLIKKIRQQSDPVNALKKNQKSALGLGRLVLLKCLSPLKKEQEKEVMSMLKSVNQFQGLTQHLFQTTYQLLSQFPQQKIKSYIDKILTTNIKDQVFKQCIMARIQSKEVDVPINQLDQLLGVLIEQLPKQPIVTRYLVDSIKLSEEGWKELWKHLIQKYGDQSDYNYKGIWIILDLFEKVVSSIDSKTFEKIKVTELWDLWMNDLNVLNKKGKQKAYNIRLNVGDNTELANSIVNYIHSNNIFINNLHYRHPLQNIYKAIDVDTYLNKLLGQLQDNQKPEWVSQMYSVVHINFDKVEQQLLQQVILVLLKYHFKYPTGEKYLQMVWSIMNIKNRSMKATQVYQFNKKLYKSLFENRAKIFTDESVLNEINLLDGVVNKCSKQLKGLPENLKTPLSNFIINALIFSLPWHEQIQTCLQFPPLLQDFQKFLQSANSDNSGPHKKRKRNQPEAEASRPIHALLQILISFLTRSPTFLRNSIEKCFEELIQYYNQEDLEKLIAVIFKPNTDYIEQS